ncbi:MAG: hypothetical protein H3C48_17655 [Chitinophagaceae bacterium]|nr:hypothetical protein [Chitinophagaceae bacterium]
MKYLILLFAGFSSFLYTYAQDMSPLLSEAAKLEKDLKEKEALDVYQSILKIQPGQIDALCKSAELTARIGDRLKTKEQKSAYFKTAKSFAEKALNQKQNVAEAYYVMAYTDLKLASVSKAKEKAGYLRDVKFLTDSALLYNPNHAGALYLLGKWNIETLNLNMAEKAAIKVIFGGMPPASLEKAIEEFEKSRSANQWMVITYLDLAKAYVQNHETGKAIDVLKKMVRMPPRTEDDEDLKAEGRALLASLQ